MSFPKAKVKRFNDVDNEDIPPVGAYDLVDKNDHGVLFDKAERFKKPSDVPLSGTVTRVRSKDSLTEVRITPNSTPRKSEALSLKREKSDLTRRVETQGYELMKLQMQLDKVIAEKTQLEVANGNLTVKLSLYESSTEDLNERAKELLLQENELAKLRMTCAEKDSEIAKLRSEMRFVRGELEEKCMILNENGTQGEASLSSLENFRLIKETIEQSEILIESKFSDIFLRSQNLFEMVKHFVEKMKNNFNKEKEKNCLLQDLLKIETDAKSENVRQLESLKQELKNFDSQNRELNEKNLVLSIELELAIKEKDLILSKLQEEIKQREDKFEEITLLETTITEQKSQSEQDRAELEYCKSLISTLQANIEDEKNKSCFLQCQLGTELDSSAAKSKLLNSIEQELKESRSENASLNEEILDLSMQLKEVIKEMELNMTVQEEMKLRVCEFKTKELLLETQLAKQTSTNENERAEFEAYRNQMEEVRSENCQLLETVDKLSLAVSEKESYIITLLEEIKRHEDSFKATVKLLETKLNELTLQHKLEKKECDAYKIKTEEVFSENCQLLETVKTLLLTTNEKESSIVALQEEMKQREDSFKEREYLLEIKLTQQISQNEMEKEELRSCHSLLENEVDNLKSRIVELSVEQEVNEKTIEKLKTKLSRKVDELSQFQEVLLKNNELLSLKGSLAQDLEKCHEKLSSALANNDELVKTLNNYMSLKSQLESQIKHLNSENQKLDESAKCLMREAEVNEDKFKRSVHDLRKRLQETEKELNGYKAKTDKEGQHNESLLQKLTTDYETRLRMATNDLNNQTEELKKWRSLYEQLKEQIAPFQDQLDAYMIEKQLLESQNVEATSTLKKMGDQLANLVGHHNQRQRIHYVNKLKEDFFRVKEENTKLWAEVLKLRKHQSDGTRPPRKFDPTKAFQHSKENTCSPLRDPKT